MTKEDREALLGLLGRPLYKEEALAISNLMDRNEALERVRDAAEKLLKALPEEPGRWTLTELQEFREVVKEVLG